MHRALASNALGVLLSTSALFTSVQPAVAIIDATLQMQLGNPSGATADPNNHDHYLIQRTVEAIDYSDNLGEPNWASWDLTSSDLGSSGRCGSFYTDTNLPSTFTNTVTEGCYSGSGYDRGHMCPSADRTDSSTNNCLLFYMSNMVPQNPSNNSGIWSSLEDYERSLASSYEVLITCGPSGFGSTTICSGHVHVPSSLWKVIVCAPLGSGTALSRVTAADPGTIRVIAVEIPNVSETGHSWTEFVTSTKQVQYDTGLTFFNALPNNLAWVLRSEVDGQTPAAPGSIGFSPSSGMVGTGVTITGANLDSTTNVTINGASASYTITATNQLTAIVPAGATTGPVSVRTLGGTATSSSSFTVTTGTGPDLAITKTHTGNFIRGDSGDTYTIIVTNVGNAASSNTVTVTDALPTGLTATAISGTGWTATLSTLTCTRSDALAAAASYPPITVTVDVSSSAPASVTNGATVSGGNDVNSANNAATDPTTINAPGAAQLSVSPSSGLASSGYAGGPFSPARQVYALTNSGGALLQWTANKTADWLTLSVAGGSLAPGVGTNVTVSINSTAYLLAAGNYSDTVGFTNITNGAGNTTRDITLTIAALAPIPQANGATLGSEGCAPTNGVVDPGETVSVGFSILNAGTGPTADLVATLLATNGVTAPSGPQEYGVIDTGTSASQVFTFTASGSCGTAIQPTLQLQDGTNDLGTLTYTIPLGKMTAMLAQDFDGVATPTLPSGWTSVASGAASNWVTSAASADSAPNAAFSADPAGVGVNELDAPSFTAGSSAPAQLTFRQKYNLTASATNAALGYDGGVLEISIDGGAFQDVVSAGGTFVTGGYNATLSSGYSNPLAGRQAWSGYPSGFVTSTVNLPAVTAGQNIQLRWRCATGNPPPPAVMSSGTLAFWNFDSGTMSAATALVPNYTNAYITVTSSGSFTPLNGAAFYTGSGGGGFLSTGPFFQGNPTTGYAVSGKSWSTSAGPVTSSMPCWAFALTVTNGMQAGLSSLSFDDKASGTGAQDFDVQISRQTDFSSVIYDSGAKTTHSGFTTTPMNTLALSNTGLTGTVYFRIYGYGATSASGTWRVDNVNVQGTVTSGGATAGDGWYVDSISVSQIVCCVAATPPPEASFTAMPGSGAAPLSVNFTNISTGGSSTSWTWTFGDGNYSTAQNTSNTYVNPGAYSAQLIASNAGGWSTNSAIIHVYSLYDWWRNSYFNGTNTANGAPGADADGTGMSNTNRFLAGFDPTNSAAYLHIISIATTNTTDINVIYLGANGDSTYEPGIASRTNVLEFAIGGDDGSYSDNFTTTGQTNILSGGTGLGVVTNMVDPGGAISSPSRYYRVRVLLP
ncbi:MAG TPA: DNA/RNA non-specific endonuclease [Verrucomicrobiae bacterium]|nr:DNA/RNA non-specific endonuclease [Verrucomicrobiae bacterium]